MAKQLGYSDDDLEAIRKEEGRTQFSPEIQIALKFAECMTRDPHRLTEEEFANLRNHYSEEELVELASVIGLTIYFNRFNSIFQVDLTGSDAPYESYKI